MLRLHRLFLVTALLSRISAAVINVILKHNMNYLVVCNYFDSTLRPLTLNFGTSANDGHNRNYVTPAQCNKPVY